MAEVTVVGICKNGFLGQHIIAGDSAVSIEDCKEFLRKLLGYKEFRVFQSYEDFEKARLEEYRKTKHFIVTLSPNGSIKGIYEDADNPEEFADEDWIEEFDNYEKFLGYNSLSAYTRVLRKAETDEGKEFLKGLGWHFMDGGHYPF